MQGRMLAQPVKFARCLIWTQLWSAEANHKKESKYIKWIGEKLMLTYLNEKSNGLGNRQNLGKASPKYKVK